MKVDTGAAVSLISYKTYQNLFASVPLEKFTIQLSTFIVELIPVVGQMTVDVRYGSQGGAHHLYVVKGADKVCLDETCFRTFIWFGLASKH